MLRFRALLLAASVVATYSLPQSGSSHPNIVSIVFGTCVSGCTVEKQSETFPTVIPINTLVTFSPALPTDSTVSIKLEQNGTELVGQRETITATEPAPCILRTYPALEVGHYRVEYEIAERMIAPISGEFDIVPAPSPSALATSSATSSPSEVVALVAAVAITSPNRAKLGTATVLEAREPEPARDRGICRCSRTPAHRRQDALHRLRLVRDQHVRLSAA